MTPQFCIRVLNPLKIKIEGQIASGRRKRALAVHESAIEKVDPNVMDDSCDTDNSLAAGVGDRLHHGFVYSYSICNGCCPDVGQHQSGGCYLSRAETHVAQSQIKE
jgi:hypothetical protein